MHASIPTVYFLSLVFFPIFLSFLFGFFVYSFIFYSFFFYFLRPSFTVHGYPFLYHLPLWDLPFFVPQPFLAPYWYPFRTTHEPAGCLTSTSAQSVLVVPLSILRQNYLSYFLPLSILVLPMWKRIKLPHHLPLWHASSGPSPYLPLLDEMPSQMDISPKEA